MSTLQFDVVIVGSGIAALTTALAAAPRRVALVTRGDVGNDGASRWAQGGIAVALAEGDSPDLHADDTLLAGAYLNDVASVRRMTAAAGVSVQWLEGIGARFDRDAHGYVLGREAAHTHPRIVHASGDASGAEVMRALRAAALAAVHIRRFEHATATGLLRRGDRVIGVQAVAPVGSMNLVAPTTVLATGGIGALYRHTTNPASADGSGLGLALAVGAALSDLEFVQFHPTALAPADGHSGQLPLLTEALRGAGAVLIDACGRRFMPGYARDAELAPRDVVARAVWQELELGRNVYLDATLAIGSEFARRFPTVHASCRARGIDPSREPIPVVPAQHYHMGGIAVDSSGASSVAGLYAVDEVARSGVHGANRLASNSLLEGLVFGRALGVHLSGLPICDDLPRDLPGGPVALDVPASIDARIRDLMWRHAGLVRDGAGLGAAAMELDALQVQARSFPLALSRIRVARALVEAALQRRDSLGAHFRRDARVARSA
ncbi:MAG: L-aspartate oxidase [Tahibacter sp.]